MGTHTLARRIEARELIRTELTLSGNDLPLHTARAVHRAWFDAVDDHVRHGRIVIFDCAVVGRPSPLMWEVTHLARLGASTVVVDPDLDQHEERHDTDERIPEFVVEMLNTDADRARCVDGSTLGLDICRRFDDSRTLAMIVRLELLLAFADDHARVGQGIVAAVLPTVHGAAAA